MVGPAILIGSVVVALLSTSVLLTVAALLAAALGLYLAWHGFAFVVDATEGTVAFVTGVLGCTTERGRYGTYYYAHIGPVTKRISSHAYDSLPRGEFHLYYAPGCRSLLSVEPVAEDEPKPPHPFGPDSAHVWDRLRASWVAMTIGVLGLLIGVHAIAVAHPAHPFPVSGTVSNYDEHHGKGGTYRYLYLGGDPDSYTPQPEDSYDPPLPPFDSLIGQNVVLYLNEGTRNVLAIRDARETLHAADWYVHPDHETVNEATNGALSAGLSLLAIVGGAAGTVLGRQRLSPPLAKKQGGPDPRFARTPMYSRSPLFAPPGVRPWYANWAPALLLLLVSLAVAIGLAIATRT